MKMLKINCVNLKGGDTHEKKGQGCSSYLSGAIKIELVTLRSEKKTRPKNSPVPFKWHSPPGINKAAVIKEYAFSVLLRVNGIMSFSVLSSFPQNKIHVIIYVSLLQ